MNKAVQFFKDWMLPLAIVTGISLYLFYYFTPLLKPWGGIPSMPSRPKGSAWSSPSCCSSSSCRCRPMT